MPAEKPSHPDASAPSADPIRQGAGKHPTEADVLNEIQQQMRLLAQRMERAEQRLGIETRSPVSQARPAPSPEAPSRTEAPGRTVQIDANPPSPPQSEMASASKPLMAPAEPTPPTAPISNPQAVIHRPVSPQSTVAQSLPDPEPKPQPSPESRQQPQTAWQPLPQSTVPQSTPSQSAPPAQQERPLHLPIPGSVSTWEGTRNNADSAAEGDVIEKGRLIDNWENLIGGKWALWVGLFSLFLAIASFLAYTWKSLPPAPPSVRMALGIAAGFALIGAGGFFRTRTQRWFSEGLSGAGLAVLYLSIWAGAQQYHLLSFSTAFTAMALTTALGVYLAIRFDALSLCALATLGGFLTPLLLHGQGNSAREALHSGVLHSQSLSLLTYVAVLNAGILAVSLSKRWNSLTWLSFGATICLIGLWMIDDYNVAHRWPTFAYFTLYFLFFIGTSCFYSLTRREQTAQPDLLLLFAATSVYAIAGYMLLNGALGSVPGTFAFALALFFGFLCGAVKILAAHNNMLRQSTAGLALLFITVAIPIQFQQQGLAIGWCIEAAVLLIIGYRLRADLLLRAGQIVWCLSLVPLLGVLLEVEPKPAIPFLNERALPLLLSLVATGLVVAQRWLLKKESSTRAPFFDGLAPICTSYIVLGAAWLLAQETYLCFSWNRWPNSGTWHAGALYTISICIALYAAGAFAIGTRARDVTVSLCALAIAAVAIALPLWTGAAFSTEGWTPFWNLRWMAYIVIGLALAAIGWMMNRSKDIFASEEIEVLGFWSVAVSLFVLAGMSLEIYFGFDRGSVAANGEWRAGAFMAIAILWSAFAAATLYLSYAWRQPALRLTALLIAGMGGLLLVTVPACYPTLEWDPILNLRSLAYGLTVGFLALIAAMEHGRSLESSGTGSTTDAGNEGSALVSQAAALLAACLLLWGLTQESYGTFSHFQSLFNGHWKARAHLFLCVLWSTGFLALLFVGLQRSLASFRALAYALAALSGILLVATALDAFRVGWLPIVNVRFATFIVVPLLAAAGSILLRRHQSKLSEWEQQVSALLGWGAAALLLWCFTQEGYETCFYFREVLGSHWPRWAQMVISLVWSVYGAALLIGGINRNYQPIRLAALALLCLTVVKVFLFDLAFLSGPLRMFSLAGLGLSLIFISWLYGRYARNGREDNDKKPGVARTQVPST